MTVAIPQINTAADTFEVWIDKTNNAHAAISNNMVSVDLTAPGSLSSGNGHVNGVFSANTLAANVVRGGNVSATSNLQISSNVWVGNSTANVWIGFANVVVDTMVVNTVGFHAGADVSVNASSVRVGNSTVNVVINSSAVALSGTPLVTTDTRTAVANNGTLIGTRGRLNLIPGTGVALAISDHSAGNQVNVTIASTATTAGADTQVLFNDAGSSNGVAGLTFSKVTNNFSVANTVEAVRVTTTGNVVIGGTVNVAANAVLSGTVNVAANAVVSGHLAVTNTATFSNTTLHTGAATFSNTIGVTGAATFSNTIAVTNAATFSNTISVTRAATFSNTVAVTGNATFSNVVSIVGPTLTLGDVSANVVLSGNAATTRTNLGLGALALLATANTAQIDNDAVTYAKMQNVSAASRLLGRGSASGAGDPEEISLGSGLTMTGTTLSASGGGLTLLDSYDVAASGSTASIAFDDLGASGYKGLLVVATGVSHSSGSDQAIILRLGPSGTTWRTSGYVGVVHNRGLDSSPSSVDTVGDETGHVRLISTSFMNAGREADGVMYFWNHASASIKTSFDGRAASRHDTSSTGITQTNGRYNTAEAHDSVQVLATGGNIDAGLIQIYGIN
jgi:hypothetical protein